MVVIGSDIEGESSVNNSASTKTLQRPTYKGPGRRSSSQSPAFSHDDSNVSQSVSGDKTRTYNHSKCPNTGKYTFTCII